MSADRELLELAALKEIQVHSAQPVVDNIATKALAATAAIESPTNEPVATVVGRIVDALGNATLRVGWLRPEQCEVGTQLFAAPVSQEAPATADILREVIRTVRQYPDFDEPDNAFGVMMDEALAGNIPALLVTIGCLAQGIAPPASTEPAPSEGEKFRAHLKASSEAVKDWPSWKRDMWPKADDGVEPLPQSAPAEASNWKWPTFEDWLASPIVPPANHVEYVRMAFEAARAHHASTEPAPSDTLDKLEAALNPRRWTTEMSHAWHQAIPNVGAAFAALRAAALAQP